MSLEHAYSRFAEKREEALSWLQHEVTALRTGRVTANLVERLQVEHYGTRTPLQGLASLSISDARTIVISPWDPAAMPAIEKALTEAQLGANPVVDNKIIRLSFPSLTEEMRTTTLKMLHKKAEETRVKLRQARDESLSIIRKEKEAGELTEDDFYEGRQELDALIGKANDAIADLLHKKEEEIRAV